MINVLPEHPDRSLLTGEGTTTFCCYIFGAVCAVVTCRSADGSDPKGQKIELKAVIKETSFTIWRNNWNFLALNLTLMTKEM